MNAAFKAGSVTFCARPGARIIMTTVMVAHTIGAKRERRVRRISAQAWSNEVVNRPADLQVSSDPQSWGARWLNVHPRVRILCRTDREPIEHGILVG